MLSERSNENMKMNCEVFNDIKNLHLFENYFHELFSQRLHTRSEC